MVQISRAANANLRRFFGLALPRALTLFITVDVSWFG